MKHQIPENTELNDQKEEELYRSLSVMLSDPDVEDLRKQLLTFDTFKVLNVERYELRHTTTLAWLLDPYQSHNLGGGFLQSFLKEVFGDQSVRLLRFGEGQEFIDNIAIHPELRLGRNGEILPSPDDEGNEKKTKARRKTCELDVVVEGPTWAVAIEAKIDSKEGDNQLSDYTSSLEKRFAGKEIFRLYLTVKPEPEVLGKNPEWIGIQWGQQIVRALRASLTDRYKCSVLETVTRNSPADERSLVEFLFRYLALLERLCNELHGLPESVQEISDKYNKTLAALKGELERRENSKSPILPWLSTPCWGKLYWRNRILFRTLNKYLRSASARFTAEVVDSLVARVGLPFHFLTPEQSRAATIRLYPDAWQGCVFPNDGSGVPVQELIHYRAEFRTKDIEFKLHLPDTTHRKLQRQLVEHLERLDKERPDSRGAATKGRMGYPAPISPEASFRDNFVSGKTASLKVYSISLYWKLVDVRYELETGEEAKLDAIKEAIAVHTSLLTCTSPAAPEAVKLHALPVHECTQ